MSLISAGSISLDSTFKGGFFGIFNFFIYDTQHCFICRPSDSTVSEDAGIEPRTRLRLRHCLSDALTTQLDLIHTRLDLIQRVITV